MIRMFASTLKLCLTSETRFEGMIKCLNEVQFYRQYCQIAVIRGDPLNQNFCWSERLTGSLTVQT